MQGSGPQARLDHLDRVPSSLSLCWAQRRRSPAPVCGVRGTKLIIKWGVEIVLWVVYSCHLICNFMIWYHIILYDLTWQLTCLRGEPLVNYANFQ